MPVMLIRLSAELPEGALEAFPWLTAVRQPAHTALVGAVVDADELQGLLHHLGDLGVAVVELVCVPDACAPPGPGDRG